MAVGTQIHSFDDPELRGGVSGNDGMGYDGLTDRHIVPVSYTHLDVYKRQTHHCLEN